MTINWCRWVSPAYMKENITEVQDKRIVELHAQGKTVVYVILEGKIAGAMALADLLRRKQKNDTQAAESGRQVHDAHRR